MKRIIYILSISLIAATGFGQVNQDFLVPHLNIGKGFGEMEQIESAIGFGYDFGVDIPHSSFGISGFYNMNQYSRMDRELPMYREENGLDTTTIKNRSRVSTYGVKLRYTPLALQYSRVMPYVEVGGGFATHTSAWRSPGDAVLVDYSDPDCPHYEYRFRDRGVLSRSTTIMGVGEVGLLIRLYGDYETRHEMKTNKSRSGWYLGLSARAEYGGQVDFRNARANPHHFQYDSGLGAQYDLPNAHLATGGNARELTSTGRHQMVFFQVSLVKTIF